MKRCPKNTKKRTIVEDGLHKVAMETCCIGTDIVEFRRYCLGGCISVNGCLQGLHARVRRCNCLSEYAAMTYYLWRDT
jgi:hypothetical protein